jgi:hypothetical protein
VIVISYLTTKQQQLSKHEKEGKPTQVREGKTKLNSRQNTEEQSEHACSGAFNSNISHMATYHNLNHKKTQHHGTQTLY